MTENARDFLRALFGDEPFFGGLTRGAQTIPPRALLLTAIASLVTGTGKTVRVLEVGSWVGCSALTWAYAIERFGGTGEVLCVDPWSNYLSGDDLVEPGKYTDMELLLASGVAFDLFKHNVSTGPASVPIRHHRGASRDILRTLPASRFDIVYVDGSHYYDDVRADLIAARSLVADNGILCGDDLELQLSPALEPHARANMSRDFVASPQGPEYHPGVTLAIAEVLGPVSASAGTWFMRKDGARFLPIADLGNARWFIPPHWPDDLKEGAAALLGR